MTELMIESGQGDAADGWGYLAIDHADARGDREISAMFFSTVFPAGCAPLEPQ